MSSAVRCKYIDLGVLETPSGPVSLRVEGSSFSTDDRSSFHVDIAPLANALECSPTEACMKYAQLLHEGKHITCAARFFSALSNWLLLTEICLHFSTFAKGCAVDSWTSVSSRSILVLTRLSHRHDKVKEEKEEKASAAGVFCSFPSFYPPVPDEWSSICCIFLLCSAPKIQIGRVEARFFPGSETNAHSF
jgi:hypothetical protein